MRRMLTAVLLAAAVLLAGCYGPFRLTKMIHEFNGKVSDSDVIVEIVFVVFVVVPVYGVAGLADALVFNTIEYWTGDNVIGDDPGRKGKLAGAPREVELPDGSTATLVREGEGRVRIAHAGTERVLVRTPTGVALLAADGSLVTAAHRTIDGGFVVVHGDGTVLARHDAVTLATLAEGGPAHAVEWARAELGTPPDAVVAAH